MTDPMIDIRLIARIIVKFLTPLISFNTKPIMSVITDGTQLVIGNVIDCDIIFVARKKVSLLIVHKKPFIIVIIKVNCIH